MFGTSSQYSWSSCNFMVLGTKFDKFESFELYWQFYCPIMRQEFQELTNCRKLHTIRLCGEPLLDEEMIHFPLMTNLTALEVSRSGLTHLGFKTIRELTNLTELSMWNLSTISKILEEVVTLTHLTELTLDETYVSNEDLRLIFNTFRGLIILSITCCPRITTGGIAQLRMLKKLKSVWCQDCAQVASGDVIHCVAGKDCQQFELNHYDRYHWIPFPFRRLWSLKIKIDGPGKKNATPRKTDTAKDVHQLGTEFRPPQWTHPQLPLQWTTKWVRRIFSWNLWINIFQDVGVITPSTGISFVSHKIKMKEMFCVS